VTGQSRRSFLLLLCSAALDAQGRTEHLQDPITGVRVTRYVSAQHETHHYYFVSPWSPDESRIVFFRFDPEVDTLTARGRFPGALWVMNADGSNERMLVNQLRGHYHVGVNQLWGPRGEYVYFLDTRVTPAVMARVPAAGGPVDRVETPVPCTRLSPDGETMSCGDANEQGVFHLADKRYEPLVTLERALSLTPNRALTLHNPSQLQNTRYNPSGDKIMIVHRTLEDFPALVEIFVYDLKTRQLRWLASDLHHPTWRPDGKAILFVRHDPLTNYQKLIEVDANTGEERVAFDSEHVPSGHPSYHPTKPHLIITDCYGGPMGEGLAIIDTKAGTMRQLVTIPMGAKPATPPDERFPFRNWGVWFPPRKYLNEPRPVWNEDGSKALYTSEESGRLNLYIADTSGL
jgi:Tol biopolymer transport system component